MANEFRVDFSSSLHAYVAHRRRRRRRHQCIECTTVIINHRLAFVLVGAQRSSISVTR